MPTPPTQRCADLDAHRRLPGGVPAPLRRAAVTHDLAARAKRVAEAIASDLGLAETSLYRWADEIAAPTDPFVKVEVDDSLTPEAPPPSAPPTSPRATAQVLRPTLSLTTPGGYRLDGLRIDSLARLLQALP